MFFARSWCLYIIPHHHHHSLFSHHVCPLGTVNPMNFPSSLVNLTLCYQSLGEGAYMHVHALDWWSLACVGSGGVRGVITGLDRLLKSLPGALVSKDSTKSLGRVVVGKLLATLALQGQFLRSGWTTHTQQWLTYQASQYTVRAIWLQFSTYSKSPNFLDCLVVVICGGFSL